MTDEHKVMTMTPMEFQRRILAERDALAVTAERLRESNIELLAIMQSEYYLTNDEKKACQRARAILKETAP